MRALKYIVGAGRSIRRTPAFADVLLRRYTSLLPGGCDQVGAVVTPLGAVTEK
jgi:hypothetical protein